MQKMTEAIERSFEVADQPHLSLSNLRGSVDVQAGEAGSIHVEAVIHTDEGDSEHTSVSLEQPDETHVKVETRYDPARAIFKGKPCRVAYRVRVPQDCTVEISGVSSSITVTGLLNGGKLSAVSGDVEADHISGNLSISTVSGDIRASELQGEINLHTVSGQARIAASQLDAVQAETVSGNLDLETGLTAGPYSFQSLSGNVKLGIPAGTKYDLSFHTLSGNLHRRETDRGGAQVRFESTSGNLTIHEAGEASEGTTRQAPLDDESRMRILESIERGEMTPDEAIKALGS